MGATCPLGQRRRTRHRRSPPARQRLSPKANPAGGDVALARHFACQNTRTFTCRLSVQRGSEEVEESGSSCGRRVPADLALRPAAPSCAHAPTRHAPARPRAHTAPGARLTARAQQCRDGIDCTSYVMTLARLYKRQDVQRHSSIPPTPVHSLQLLLLVRLQPHQPHLLDGFQHPPFFPLNYFQTTCASRSPPLP